MPRIPNWSSIHKQDYDKTLEVGESMLDYQNNNNKMNGLLTFSLPDVARAVINAVLTAVLSYLGTVTNLVELNWSQIGLIALVAALGSLATVLGTTNKGNFAGVAQVEG